MSKKKDLQPWLDYFAMLHTYEKKGYLEVVADKHEVFVTRAALMTLLGITPDGAVNPADLAAQAAGFLRRVRAYAAWKSLTGSAYISWNFALHIVEDDHPHDGICTMLLSRRRRWQRLWFMGDSIEVISYDSDGK